MTIPTTQQLSVALERGARVAAPVVALVASCTLLLMQLAYDAGYQLGQAVHERNDQLAAAMVRLTVGGGTQPRALDPLQCSESGVGGGTEASTPAAAPMQHPLAMAADDLQRCLTAAQLRELTGTRAKLPKHRLAGMAVTC